MDEAISVDNNAVIIQIYCTQSSTKTMVNSVNVKEIRGADTIAIPIAFRPTKIGAGKIITKMTIWTNVSICRNSLLLLNEPSIFDDNWSESLKFWMIFEAKMTPLVRKSKPICNCAILNGKAVR